MDARGCAVDVSWLSLTPIYKYSVIQEQEEDLPQTSTASRRDFQSNTLGTYSVQSIGADWAVSWAVGHNPGQVATPTQDTQMAQSSQYAGTHFVDLRKMTGWVNPTWY